VKDQSDKLQIVKTIRFNETLLRTIARECENRSLAFSDFMRTAAIVAMRQQVPSPKHVLPKVTALSAESESRGIGGFPKPLR
jgi:hypothetical protein